MVDVRIVSNYKPQTSKCSSLMCCMCMHTFGYPMAINLSTVISKASSSYSGDLYTGGERKKEREREGGDESRRKTRHKEGEKSEEGK